VCSSDLSLSDVIVIVSLKSIKFSDSIGRLKRVGYFEHIDMYRLTLKELTIDDSLKFGKSNSKPKQKSKSGSRAKQNQKLIENISLQNRQK
jgi:hypothetical protein